MQNKGQLLPTKKFPIHNKRSLETARKINGVMITYWRVQNPTSVKLGTNYNIGHTFLCCLWDHLRHGGLIIYGHVIIIIFYYTKRRTSYYDRCIYHNLNILHTPCSK